MIKSIFFFVFFISIGFGSNILAQATIMINPKRVIFKSNELKHSIVVMNTGDTESNYVVSFTQQRMNEDGSFTTITEPDPGQRFADRHLRIYPRQILLKAGESQLVIIQRRRSSNMEIGEYRSHLTFKTAPSNTPMKTDEENESSSGFTTKITTLYGMSIPIILHSGEVAVSTHIKDIQLKDTLLTFNIHRKGNISTYGNFLIQYIPDQGEPITIKKLVGIAVYTTIEKRMMTFNLDKLPNIDLKKGRLKIIYEAPTGSIQQVFAEETILLKS
jgi:hypothetical protein